MTTQYTIQFSDPQEALDWVPFEASDLKSAAQGLVQYADCRADEISITDINGNDAKSDVVDHWLWNIWDGNDDDLLPVVEWATTEMHRNYISRHLY